MLRGHLNVNGTDLRAGDALALENEAVLSLISGEDKSECLIFDLPL
jgi:redox-sensitive bicupin YhaK (pirin superfamily)